MIFDTHAHYDDSAFDGDREEILAAFEENGIGAAVDVAAALESIPVCMHLADTHPQLYAAVGVHPSECAPMREEDLDMIREALHHPKVVAMGEIGLDYHWEEPTRELQQHWLEAQLQVALEEDVPIIIHSRDAAEDTMEILSRYTAERKERYGNRAGKTAAGNPRETAAWAAERSGTGGCAERGGAAGSEEKRIAAGEHAASGEMTSPGVIHCYSYSVEQARQYVKMGFYIGIGGVVTFKNAKKLKAVVRDLPLEKIVLETDCPYMAPTPHRGKRNSSLFLPLVAAEIAALKETTADEVIRATEINARKLYRLQ